MNACPAHAVVLHCGLSLHPPSIPRHATTGPAACAASISPPPPCFDYRAAVLGETRSAVAAAHPQLMDLIESGALVLVPRRRFGPVPSWRTEFAEPEAIWLLGTSHLSSESAADVERVILAVRPDNVVVELCRGRAGIMYPSNDPQEEPVVKSSMFSLTGSKFFEAISRSINLGGQSALALRLLLAVFSSKISSGANQPFGEEFRAARKVAEEIGAQLVLGDRPIEITLERAWMSLNWASRVKLLFNLLQGITSGVGPQNVAVDGDPFELYKQMSVSYPSLLQPLVHERDMYLAWSLKRSKAVNGSKVVVGVIGKGHMNGVVYALMSDSGDLRFRDLVGDKSGGRSNTQVSKLINGLIRDMVIGFAVWALYEQLKLVEFNWIPIRF